MLQSKKNAPCKSKSNFKPNIVRVAKTILIIQKIVEKNPVFKIKSSKLPQNQTQSSPKFCNYCKRNRHLINECYRQAHENARKVNKNRAQNLNKNRQSHSTFYYSNKSLNLNYLRIAISL